MLDHIHPESIELLLMLQGNKHCRFYSDFSKQMRDSLHSESIVLIPIVQKDRHCQFHSDFSKQMRDNIQTASIAPFLPQSETRTLINMVPIIQ